MTAFFQFVDAGRSASARPKQKNDCVVRAIALAFQQPYDETYELFTSLGRQCSRGTAKSVWQPYLSAHAVRVSFPAVAGQKRMDLLRFCETHRDGRWIVQTAGHVAAVIDGVVHDTHPPQPGRCVYAAWRILQSLPKSA